MLEARAFTFFAPCDAPKIARRPCIVPKGRPRSVLAFRRSRRACLLGAGARSRLSTLAFTAASGSLPSSDSRFRESRPSALLPRVHDQELLVGYTFSCLPCSPLDEHGQHSIGSQSTGSRIRVTFRREPATILFLSRVAPAPRTRLIAPALAFRRWRLPGRRLCDPCPPCDVHVPQPPAMTLADHRCACIHLSFGTGSRCCRIDLRLSTLTTRRHFRAHVRATCS
jgi:hypothetical protein